jgi:apolipoprotein N-acyltransferase
MVLGVLLSLGFVGLSVWYVNNKIDAQLKEKQWLTKFIALLLTAFLGLFIVDVLISWKIQLLDDNMRNSLFELIKNVVLVVFGYQFNSATKKPE